MAIRPMAPCTLVLLTYVRPVEEIDRLRPADVEWIEGAATMERVSFTASFAADAMDGLFA